MWRTDLAADSLPTLAGGNADPTAEGVEVIGSIAPFGGLEEITLDLTPGSYVLLCNVIDHYSRGMHAPFKVT